MNVSILTLAGVLLLIAARGIAGVGVRIWQAMAVGALVVLLTGQISLGQAIQAIDTDVMLFLFGMFVVGEALIESGYLYFLAQRLFCRVRSTDGMVLTLLMAGGAASALLMNDTLAIIGTPLVLRWAREHRIDSRLLLLALAFAITIGSVPSPIGNPQNLLIASGGHVTAPFVTFFGALALPTVVNLFIAYGVLRILFHREFHATELVHGPVSVRVPALAALVRLSLLLIIAAVIAKIMLVAMRGTVSFPLSYIGLVGALPLLLLSRQRLKLLWSIDWSTLVFFAAMFILMASVWQSGFLQMLIARLQPGHSALQILSISLLLSQLISNVPMVALYLPVLTHLGSAVPVLMALAAGSTIAGNFFILGAASNVIIIQRAENHGATLGFWTFARAGIPLTFLNVCAYWLYLDWFYNAVR